MKALINKLASVKITVVCLFLLFVLTFWGTVAQVDHGLYAAQQRYFFSFFFLVLGFLPFPGAQSVLWVLFVNLCASSATHFSKTRGINSIGLKVSHSGVLIYFIAAFIVFHGTTESNVTLAEGEGTNLSASYTDWEIAYWKSKGNERIVTAFDMTHSHPGDLLPFDHLPFKVFVKQFYLNANAFVQADNIILEPKELKREREKNIAGGIFEIKLPKGESQDLVLYAGKSEANEVKVGGITYYFILRHKSYVLPFAIRLKEFHADFHPGTQVAKSFESKVEIIKPNVKRDVRIFMNNPLREKEYTFYQASYHVDQFGKKYSTLAVVKNVGQILPYIACFVVFFGLSFHFILMALRRKRL